MYINTELLTSEEKDELIKFFAQKYTEQQQKTLECTDFMAHIVDEITDFVITDGQIKF